MARTLQARFDARVDRSGDHHLWLGSIHPRRRTGQLKVDGRVVTAHRVAWELQHGSLHEGQRVRACPDEPACVNVDHLSLVGVGTAPPAVIAESGSSSSGNRRNARGAGSKRQRGPGTWELSVVSGTDIEGRSVRSFRTFQGSEPEATKALAVFTAEVAVAGPLVRDTAEAGALTVQRLIDEFRHHLEQDKGRRPTTMVRYRGLQRKWIDPYLGSKRTERVLPEDIDAVLGRMRRATQSQSSIHQTRTLLNGAFKWAKRNRRVSSNPCAEIEEPRSAAPAREVLPPDVNTIRALIGGAFELEFEFGVACHLGAATGMRRGEIAGLRWSRVHLDAGYLVVAATVSDAGGRVVVNDFTKTRRTRRISLDEHTLDLLREVRRRAEAVAEAGEITVGGDAFVFTRTPGGAEPLRPDLFSKRMKRLRASLGPERAEFDATLQAIRHWTQTALSEAGYNSRQVALRGGHSEQLMKRVYVHRTSATEAEMTAYLGALLR
jgi:integrase